MLRLQKGVPLDYGMCCMTVTVYHREGLTRQVITNAHLEFTRVRRTAGGITEDKPTFLLVVPGELAISPGDKVAPGECPEVSAWAQAPGFVAGNVKPRYFMGRVCHTEVRG